MCALDAGGAATMENLRAELARAKEQARKSDAAASKAAEDLKAEKGCSSSKRRKDSRDGCGAEGRRRPV